MRAKRALSTTVIKFTVVGLLSTFVYNATTLLFSSSWIGLRLSIASMIGFIISLVFSYLGHATFSFGTPVRNTQNIMRFITVSTGLSVTLSLLCETAVTRFYVPREIAVALVSLIYPPVSLVLNMCWTFRQPTIAERPK